MKKLNVFILVFFLLGIVSSCSDEDPVLENQMDLSNLSFEGFEFKMNPVTVSLKDYPIDQLFEDVANEVMKINTATHSTSRTTGDEMLVGLDMLIDPEKEEVTIIPIDGVVNHGDDEDCGGKEGDGWKSYDTCFKEDCVKNALEETGKDLGAPEVGECIELRVKRNRLNATVCGRKIKC